jgi:hypothetical protein
MIQANYGGGMSSGQMVDENYNYSIPSEVFYSAQNLNLGNGGGNSNSGAY